MLGRLIIAVESLAFTLAQKVPTLKVEWLYLLLIKSLISCTKKGGGRMIKFTHLFFFSDPCFYGFFNGSR